MKNILNLSIQSLIIIILFIIAFIGNKNKIDINFSKKENKRLLYGIIFIIIYIYFDKIKYIYKDLKKDAIEPGTGTIGSLYDKMKNEIKSLNQGKIGEIKDKIMNWDNAEVNLKGTYEINDTFKDELKRQGVIAIIETIDNKLYSLKSKSSYGNRLNNYVIESKINNYDMLKTEIRVNKYNPDYKNLYSLIKNVIVINEQENINDILFKPEKPILDIKYKDNCAGCHVQNLSEYNANIYMNKTLNTYSKFSKCIKLPKENIQFEFIDGNGNKIQKNKEVQKYNCCVSCPDDCFPALENYNKNFGEFTQEEIKDIIISQKNCQNI